jgi:hypothetical protein
LTVLELASTIMHMDPPGGPPPPFAGFRDEPSAGPAELTKAGAARDKHPEAGQ